MKSNYKNYDHEESVKRIDEILTTSDASFQEVDSIPSRDKLTFTNGFYVNCSAIFIDLRDSSNLPSRYKRPSLARIYRSYISEMVALLNGESHCAEVNIAGDCVWAVFDTPYTSDINDTFSTSAKINSLSKILNCRFRKKKGYNPIKIGIGLSYGRALMIKAGSKGSTINEVVWMGEVVNYASHLCNQANKNGNNPILISNVFYNNLNDTNKGFMSQPWGQNFYHGNVINVVMDEWLNNNCSD